MVGEHVLPNFVGDPGVGEDVDLGVLWVEMLGRCVGGSIVGGGLVGKGFSEEGLLDGLSVLLLDTLPELPT